MTPRKAAKKRGVGRPPRTEPRDRVVFLLAPELRIKLRVRAAQENRNQSQVIAEALRAYFARPVRIARA